jgi:CubicO group peptidase (beta-lactamase class C family)
VINRRAFLGLAAGTTLATTKPRLWALDAVPTPAAQGAAQTRLDAYTTDYMRAMNAPGMTQALTDTKATIRTAAYGYANVDLKTPVAVDQLFQIGSITKSFVALIMLQLRDEGKVDFNRPVIEYLPWLPISMPYGPITAHHLLTHTSGLPDAAEIFQGDPEARHTQGFAPGEHFHYCNLGFNILGELIQKIDGRLWYQALQARLLTPLGMSATAPVITIESSARSATGYQPYFDDQQYPRQGRLVARPPEVFDSPAGSIAAPPGDMAKHLRMLLNSGRTESGRVVTAEGFALMSTAYVKAPEFSPTASYGYGIAVDTLDGHKILRHTGGMNCFASSIHVDMDSGVAAFASINAMQGYRPTAVTQYAVRLLRAEHESKPLPAAEAMADPTDVDNASEYEGTYLAVGGKQLTFKADGKHLVLVQGTEELVLQRGDGDSFVSTAQGKYADYSLVFGRDQAKPQKPATPTQPAIPALVVEVGYGPDWYINSAYKGSRQFPSSPDWARFEGRYRSDGGDDAQVFQRKGRLWMGDSPLTQLGASLFRVGDDSWSPDTAEFLSIVEGKARLMRVTGFDYRRVEVDPLVNS